MRDLLERIITIAKAYGGAKKASDRERDPDAAGGYASDKDPFDRSTDNKQGHSSAQKDQGSTSGRDSFFSDDWKTYPGGPQKLQEDLAVFGLKPPSSLKEIQKARNREIKKYHSDLHMDDPEKFEAANEIMQIYNAAYERLKKYYS